MSATTETIAPALPSAATAQAGEHYAGIAFENGKPSHHLFLLDARPAGRLAWKAAKDWATSIDASLPTRFESALLYANLQDQFDKSEWHWTDTQSSADCAFCQYFGSGYQYGGDKNDKLLARAVRRLPL